MKTDRELLELAAKAAGLHIKADRVDADDRFTHFVIGAKNTRERTNWNPLTDDGDALRLAVKTGEPFVVRTRCVTTMGGLIEDFDPNIAGDDLRATRRVIVRAAAEIQLHREKA